MLRRKVGLINLIDIIVIKFMNRIILNNINHLLYYIFIYLIAHRCIQLEYPLLAEYDFRNDTANPDIQ